ncbi:MAG: vWA domain-containing protein [Thermoproteota archaeon]
MHKIVRFSIIILLLLLLLFIGEAILVIANEEKTAGISMPVTPFGKPLDVILILDQSGSMLESDKSNVRVSAAGFLVEYLASFQSEYFDHRMGVVNFGTSAPQEYSLAPVHLTADGIETVKGKIVPMNLGNTNVLAAFQESRRLFDSVADERPRKKVVVLFTDGEPDINGVTPAVQLFPEIISYFRNNLSDVTLYVVGVDERNAFWDKDRPFWEEIASSRTIRLEGFDETELKKTYAGIVVASFSDEKIEWFETPEADIEVEPYLESMNVVLLKGSPDTRITVENPQGYAFDAENVEGATDNEAYTILGFKDPMPGKWRYMVSGLGKATIGFNKIPIKVRMVFPGPKAAYPRGRPMKIVASFSKLDGTEVKEQAGVPLFPGATLTYPDGDKLDIKLVRIGTGIYESEETVVPEKTGKHSLRLYLKGGPVISETVNELDVRDLPYAAFDGMQERYERNKPIAVRAVVLLAGERVTDLKSIFPDDDPRSVMYFVFDKVPEGSTVEAGKAQFMEPDEAGVFTAREPVRLEKEGEYLLRLVLCGKLATGEKYTSIPEYLKIYVKKSRSDILILFFVILGSIAGGLLLLWFLWHYTRPVISGELVVTLNGEPIPLKGGKFVTVRGTAKIYAEEIERDKNEKGGKGSVRIGKG